MKVKNNKKTKMVLIILSVVIVLIAAIALTAFYAINNMKPSEVTDYDKRIEIWDTVAGNSTKSKLGDMNIDYDKKLFPATLSFVDAIVGDKYEDAERIIDTFTYHHEIENGFEKETYEDNPYLIPYVVEGSDSAVIVIPGGGYGYKSMDGGDEEGKDVALSLNKAGISAFVLHYRSNPYEHPIPQLDVQRAVRYLRANAETYGFNPDNIGLIGYSAGGNQVGTYINVIMGKNYFPKDYTPDGIDQIDDSVVAVGMVYPALTYKYNVPMLFCSFDSDDVRDESVREKLLKQTDLSSNFNSSSVPQFVSYGTKDRMVNMEGIKSYIASAKSTGTDIEVVVAEGQDHCFKQKYYMNEFLTFFKDRLK